MMQLFFAFLLLLSPAGWAKPMDKIGFAPHLGTQVPLDIPFINEENRPVTLQNYVSDKPLILNIVYFRCPSVCGEVLNGLLRSMRALPIDAGTEFQVITVSMDARETSTLAAAKKKVFLDRYNRKNTGKGWAFLTGSAASIQKLTDAVGYEFTYDKDADQFNHPAGLIILTPGGKVSRYLVGIDYPPEELWLALIAAEGKPIQSPLAQLWLHIRIKVEGMF